MKLIFALFVLFFCIQSILADDPTFELVPLTLGIEAPGEAAGTKFSTKYFYINIPDTRGAELEVHMINKTPESDPDLYVRFYEGNIADVTEAHLPSREVYDVADISSGDTHKITFRRDAEEIKKRLRIGYYIIGVRAYTAVASQFGVSVSKFDCYGKSCGGHGACDYLTYTCNCEMEWSVVPDCSVFNRAAVVDTKYSQLLPAGGRVLFNYVVTANNLKEFVFNIERTAQSRGSLVVYAAKDRIPSPNDYDEYASIYTPRTSLTLKLEDPLVVPGKFYFMIYADQYNSLSMEIVAHEHICLGNCSGHGTCQPDGTCKCEDNYNVLDDCSLFSENLQSGKSKDIKLGSFRTEFYSFEVEDAKAKANVDISIDAVVSKEDADNNHIPFLRINYNKLPDDQNYIVSSVRPLTKDQRLVVPRSHVKSGKYYVSLNNNDFSELNIRLTSLFVPVCKCIHGSCDDLGYCHCFKGYYGNDCSVHEDYVIEKSGKQGVAVGLTVFLVFLFTAIGGAAGFFGYKYLFHKTPEEPQSDLPGYSEINN